ncbi:MAG TPA: hypothetical protein VFG54_03805 [Prolixibacteraceae bacterium]|nr:hypothetical protein [Prolixibacteraceae bacterium]
MKSLKEFIPTLFENSEIERVDYYIEKIKESLNTTNKLFITYIFLLGLSLICFYLLTNGYLSEIELYGQKISDLVLIKKWFLVIPSAIFFRSTLIGYLRIYQLEAIEWLIVKYRNKEYTSEIFRLALPASHILGMDLLRRQENKWLKVITKVLSLFMVIGAHSLPVFYICFAYPPILRESNYDVQTFISFIISMAFIISGGIIVRLSQRI